MRRSVKQAASLAIAGTMFLAVGASAQEPDGPHPAHIHAGACPEPGDVVIPLTDVAGSTEASQGSADAVPAEVSVTTAAVPLADILGAEHAINVHESGDALDVYIACGNVGGPVMQGTDLAIGLVEQNASGHSGVAWLHDNGDGTTNVYVFLTQTTTTASTGPDLSPAPADMSPAPAADASPAAPDMSPAAPDMSPAAPEASPAAPEASPAAPEASPMPAESPAG